MALAAGSTIAAAPAGSGETVSVIVRAADASAAGAAVETVGGEVTIELPIVEGVAADVPAGRLAALDALPGVEVSDNAPVQVQGKPSKPPKPPKDPPPPPPPPPPDPTPAFVTAVGGKTLWDAGFTGTGITVAVIDTGIAEVVPDLADRVKDGIDFSGENNPKLDSFGHGTFVAGLIAGDGTDTSHDGVAPGASVLPIKIAGQDGSSDVAHVLAALQWAVSFKDEHGIRIINLSLGTDSTQPYRRSPLNYAVEKAWDAGIVVVVSASNRGLDGRGTVTKPADDPLVITVGATDDRRTGTPTDDVMAGFSGMGPTKADGLTKPDVVAPGKSVVSLRAPGSKIDTEYPSSRVPSGQDDADYFIGSGTSFSSAITAGGIALLLQHRPALTPNQVKALVMENALKGPSKDANVSGAGRLNVAAAAFDTTIGQANRNVPRSLGTGSLQADRGSLQTEFVNELNVPTLLTGLLTPQGTPFNQTQFLTTAWTGTNWYTSQWAGTNWYGTNWYGTNWYGTNWYSTNWYGATWYAAGWD